MVPKLQARSKYNLKEVELMSNANVIEMPHHCHNGQGCPDNAVAKNASELETKFGFRMLDGNLAPQSLCKPCRSRSGKD